MAHTPAGRAVATKARVLTVSYQGKVRVAPLPEAGQIVLGRGQDSFIKLLDDPLISRRHVVLHLGDEVLAEDVGSQNGTRLLQPEASAEANEGTVPAPDCLEAGRPVSLREGAVLQLGGTTISVQDVAAVGPEAAAPGGGLVVADARMRYLHELLERVAGRDINVLLLGETGVGKDVFARRLHALSPRAAGPFVGINCGALIESLLESELFGHEKGAFTGATSAKRGLLEAASGGVVFLDEVGELSPNLQVKLLRVLEDRSLLRVGAVRPTPIDVRVVSATNRDLDREVAAGRFRSDLYYRLDGISFVIPALRERGAEIVPMAQMWLRYFCEREGRRPAPALSDEAAQKLVAHRWPGNVRELRNVMERALVLCEGAVVRPEHVALSPAFVPEPAQAPSTSPPGLPTLAPPSRRDAEQASPLLPAPPLQISLGGAHADASPEELRSRADELERARILEALASCAGNQTRAAEALGLSRRAFIRKLERYNLPRPKKRDDA